MEDHSKPGLFGIQHSNRDFSLKETWGKNQFNSSFPAALAAWLDSRGIENIYLKLDENLKIRHGFLKTADLFGLEATSEELFFAFENSFSPWQQLVIGNLPRVDLVTQNRQTGQALRPIEIKLTALPDNTTCDFSDDRFGTEIVVRPDTIVYLACSIAQHFQGKEESLRAIIGSDFDQISDWTDGQIVWPFLPKIIEKTDCVIMSIIEKQEPILMQPIWKTIGKSPMLAQNCLDVFVWSNLAFAQLFLDVARGELRENNRITRQIRTIIWLFKMLFDFARNGQINHSKIIDSLSFNTKNDKAFAVSGRVTQPYMKCEALTKPRITKAEIRQIILGGGQNLLSPERRFDAIIHNSPELFR